MVLKDTFEKYFNGSYLKNFKFWMLEVVVTSFMLKKILNLEIQRYHKYVIFINIVICFSIKAISLIINIFLQEVIDENYEDTYTVYKNILWIIPFGIIFYYLIITSNSYTNSKIKYCMDLK